MSTASECPPDISALRSAAVAARAQAETDKIVAAEASAVAATAVKAEKVEAAKAAAVARNTASASKKAADEADRALARAESKAEKAAKDAAKAQAAVEAKEAARVARQARIAAATENPLLGDDVDWPALGDWAAARLQDRLCYVEGAGWGMWVGSHWQFAVKARPECLDLVRDCYRGQLTQVTVKLNANPKSAQNILDHAQAELTLPRELFNAATSAHLVPFLDRTLDLKAGKAIPHDPKHYLTGCLQTRWNPKAKVARVVEAFSRFWPNDPATAEMFQTMVGISLTGEAQVKRVPFMVGDQDDALNNGDNGKSLVQGSLARLFGLGVGGLGASIKSGIIVDTGDRDANSHDSARVPLIWRRFALAAEFRTGSAINSGEFNLLSGGDPITARPPHAENAIQFVNTTTMWFSMNTVARFLTWDAATRKRLTPFPFTTRFYNHDVCPEGGQKKDYGLRAWLESDEGMEALALYAVQGARRFYRECGGGDIPDSPAVIALREKILTASNPFNDLFEECFVFHPEANTPKAALSAVVEVFNGERLKGADKDRFVRALAGQAVREVKIKGDRYWRGVGLTERGRKLAAARGFVVGTADADKVVRMRPGAPRFEIAPPHGAPVRFCYEDQLDAAWMALAKSLRVGGAWQTIPGNGRIRRVA